MKYKITYEYRGNITVDDIIANSQEEAERIGRLEADEGIGLELSLYNTYVNEIKEE